VDEQEQSMTNVETAATPAPPAHVQLIQMCAGGWMAAAVYAAAKLGIADHLADGPRSAADLAPATGTHPPSLHRFMRTLAGFGILAEGQAQQFSLTPLGEALKTGAPGSARSTLIAFGGPAFSRAWENIIYSLETGKTGFEKAWGMPIFDYFGQHPDEASHFSAAMVGFHGSEPPTVAEAYDFSGVDSVVDVGGASGNMLAALLSRHPRLRGVLFDLPHVVRDAPALLKARAVDARVTIEEGSFFERVPAGGDAYLLSHIIHDWSEEQCLTILGHCRAAMRPDGRLLIVETVIPEGNVPHQGKLQDLVMMVIPGGQERTEAEYATLLGKAGFRLRRVVPTTSVVSIVEAVVAP
jgi:O-methyltransferase domain/Dimerisation domain